MKKSLLVPLGTVVMGILCFFLRKNQIEQVKDVETLLYSAGAMESYVLYFVLAVSLAVLGFLLFTGSRPLPNYEYMVYCPSPLFPMTVALTSLLFLLSFFVGLLDITAQKDFFQSRTVQQGIIELLQLFSIPMIVWVGILMTKAAYLGETLSTNYPILLLACPPVLFLFKTLQSGMVQPNLEDRIFPLLSGFALMYSCYFLAAATVRPPKENLFCWTAMASNLFFCTSLGGETSLYETFLGFAYHILISAFAVATMENGFCSLEVYRAPPSAESRKI